MDLTKRGLRAAQRRSRIQDETRSQNELPLEITFQTGFVRRAAQLYCAEPFEMTFHSECISLNGGFREARNAAREYKTKQGTRPFEMTSHSECISLNGGFITHSQLPPNRKSFRITPKGPTGPFPPGPESPPRPLWAPSLPKGPWPLPLAQPAPHPTAQGDGCRRHPSTS